MFGYDAVSIFFLVRQQLQRIDQISTQALRYCKRFEDLGLIDTFTCLCDQKPGWLLPIVLISTDRAPPIVAPFWAKSFPTFLARTVLFPSFSRSFPGAPFALRTVSTANLLVGFSFCLQKLVVTLA